MRDSLSILVVAFLLGRGQGPHRIYVLSSRLGLVVSGLQLTDNYKYIYIYVYIYIYIYIYVCLYLSYYSPVKFKGVFFRAGSKRPAPRPISGNPPSHAFLCFFWFSNLV